jgi:methylenetetrahydrofolate dehydrogenase (NADP+)/methenyltetrahydrofolate cyclohydrolase
MAKIIDGKKYQEEIKSQVKKKVKALKKKPKLAVILVGEDPASKIYVKMKEKACQEVGIGFQLIKISKTEAVKAYKNNNCLIKKIIKTLNEDRKISAILLQLPIPKEIPEKEILNLIDPKKDVDCLHPLNLGEFINGTNQDLIPCTPKGCLFLIRKQLKNLAKTNAVVVGRSEIVGKPMAFLLLRENSTVTICHSQTRDLKEYTKKVDILVVAAGVPGLIKKKMVKKGAIVIDVGIHRIDGKIVGDVVSEEVKKQASAITPVPGGVGPMTIAMLLENILICFNKVNN